MSDAFEPETPAIGQEQRQLVCLGDGQGENTKLSSSLEKLAGKVNGDADGGYWVIELLQQLRDVGWVACLKLADIVKTAVSRFTEHETKLIKAKAEAEKLTAEAEAIRVKANAEATATVAAAKANAEKTRAEAEEKLAEASKKRAEAARLQSQVGERSELLKRLKKRGIDFQAEVGEGVMRIVVTKQQPQDTE